MNIETNFQKKIPFSFIPAIQKIIVSYTLSDHASTFYLRGIPCLPVIFCK